MDLPIELGKIIRQEKHAYYEKFSVTTGQKKVLRALECCRTEKLGIYTIKCDQCDYQHARYKSCRDRHCPKCQGVKQAQWAAKLRDQLLPCRYFHIVFTMPHQLHEVTYSNQQVVYDILMKSAIQALNKVAANPRFLGATTGSLSILHTWGQNLLFHPHVHMLVPAGGISQDGWEWKESGKKFFVPVRVLSKVFRGVFISKLKAAYLEKRIEASISFRELIPELYAKNWVVYSKKVFGGPGQVITYLGRYTHRVAISNSRILSHLGGKVSFTWKDYKQKHNPIKVMKLDSLEFIRRFLLHVLPCNFYKIRYSGIFANKVRGQLLERCNALLEAISEIRLAMVVSQKHNEKCPKCHVGNLLPLIMCSYPDT